jgi:tetratricopeptide (TPR) repeat protein
MTGRTLLAALTTIAMAHGCGPAARGTPPGPPPAGGTQGPTGLAQGKEPASTVTPVAGTLVTRIDEEQIEMVYAPQGPFSPAERLSRAMDQSIHAFRSEPLGTAASNFHELLGGMREPDPFLVMVEEGNVRTGKPYPADPAILEELASLLGNIEDPTDQDAALCEALEKIAKKDPAMPVLNETLAGCYQQTGQMKQAIKALARELEINPSNPSAHLWMAAAYSSAGRIDDAREHLLDALFYYPAFPEARKWLDSGGLPGTRARVQTFTPRIAVVVDAEGFVVSRAPENQPWAAAYASCKAGFRYAPEVRMAFGMKAEPYKPSLLEEMVCLRLAGDAYRGGVASGAPAEEIGELLVRAAAERRLLEAALFEVIGYNDPDIMKFLPESVTGPVRSWIEDAMLVPATG